MKVCTVLFLFVLINIVRMEPQHYPRFKVRGPPMPVRTQPPPQFMKKWYQPPPPPPPKQKPQRRPQRPIPVHMPMTHKIPMGVPQAAAPRPVAPPVRTFWKNTQTTYRTPVEKHGGPDKFISAPTINIPEYDFQLQTNNIPTQVKPIKQVGEKGPIHTIPAPKLSPADKPLIFEEVKTQHYQQHHQPIQKSHQYQVTEPPPPPPPPQQQQQQQIYETPQSDQGVLYQSNLQQPILGEQQLNLNNKELYHIVNVYPQQEVLETYNIPVFEQQLQQETGIPPQYLQALLSQQPQLFQTEYNHIPQQQQHHELMASDKASFQPEFHTFNYEEPRQKSVKATYTLEQQQQQQQHLENPNRRESLKEPETSNSEIIRTLARHPLDSLAQSQYIQNYFGTNDNGDNKNVNKIQPDAKPSQATIDEVKNDNNDDDKDDLSPSLFTSLPNKEAADVLATLQAAGKLNSNLMKIPKKAIEKNPMSIYVPDDAAKQTQFDDQYDQEYDDYSQEDLTSSVESQEDDDQSFGHKLKPKRR